MIHIWWLQQNLRDSRVNMTASQTYNNNGAISGGGSLLENGALNQGSQSTLAGNIIDAGNASPGPNSVQPHHISMGGVGANPNHQGNRR